MPRRDVSGDGPDDEQMRRIRALVKEMSPEQLRTTLDQVMSMTTDRALSVVRAQRDTHRDRRPRREVEATFRVRLDLIDAKPPIWRRLELSSSLTLAQVHDVIQVVFDWSDTHLHRFALGPSVWDEDSDLFLCPYDVEDGEVAGTPASEMRLDELLGEVGDTMLYVYDYGDSWELRIRLEAILERSAATPRAVCTGGRRASPPEDFGGIYAYDLHVHEQSGQAGGVPDDVEVDRVNVLLLAAQRLQLAALFAPPLLGSFLQRSAGTPASDFLADLLVDADLGEPVEIRLDDATNAVRRYAWLLERVGDDGITLTAAGYLPPVHVSAAMAELGMDEEWIGKGNREDLTLPVLHLRESARHLGLLRKHRGRLVLTSAARQAGQDPVALWRHIARRLPTGADGSVEQHAGMLCLLGIAAGRDSSAPSFRAAMADSLTAYGWRVDGDRVPASSIAQASWDTVDVFRNLGAFEPALRSVRDGAPTPPGRAMARVALQQAAVRRQV